MLCRVLLHAVNLRHVTDGFTTRETWININIYSLKTVSSLCNKLAVLHVFLSDVYYVFLLSLRN
jgi:hypothetical protein